MENVRGMLKVANQVKEDFEKLVIKFLIKYYKQGILEFHKIEKD